MNCRTSGIIVRPDRSAVVTTMSNCLDRPETGLGKSRDGRERLDVTSPRPETPHFLPAQAPVAGKRLRWGLGWAAPTS